MFYTSDDLITAIKRNASIPTSQRKFTTSDFLAFLNEELRLTIVTALVSAKQDYFMETLATALVANQSEYDFPERAIGWKVGTVGYLDSSDNYYKLSKINRSERGGYGTIEGSSPRAFYVMGSKIVLVPSIGSTVSGSLQTDFVRIQNELVGVNTCGRITNVVNLGLDYQITVDTVPATGNGIDVISGLNPYNIFARQSTPVVAGFNLTCPIADFEREPQIGDYVAAYGTTPIPNIPEDFHPVLAQAATIRCLITMSDAKGLATARESYQTMMSALMAISSERVDSSPTKIVPKNRILNMMR